MGAEKKICLYTVIINNFGEFTFVILATSGAAVTVKVNDDATTASQLTPKCGNAGSDPLIGTPTGQPPVKNSLAAAAGNAKSCCDVSTTTAVTPTSAGGKSIKHSKSTEVSPRQREYLAYFRARAKKRSLNKKRKFIPHRQIEGNDLLY